MTFSHERATGHPELSSRYLTETAAGEYLDVSGRTIRRWVSEGKLKAFRAPSGRYRFRQSDLDAALTPVPNGAGGAA